MSGRSVDVLLEDTLVGRLVEANEGMVSFHFVDSYRRLPRRPVLGQKFEDDHHRVYRGKHGELPAFFANLVPEGPLRELLERSTGVSPGDDLGLLAAVGQDLPGAVILRPSIEPPDAATEAVASVTDTDSKADNGDDEATPQLRFSLAGVQLKLSLVRDASRQLTLPARGQRGEWIAKLASPAIPGLPENEHTMLEWARAAGFDVPECHLQRAEDMLAIPRQYIAHGTYVLAVRRYDRDGMRRIHQEDFAQVVGSSPRFKYENITYEKLAAIVSHIIDRSALDEIVRRLALIVACGNHDAHLKNWSLIYPDGIAAKLSPLYDQVCTVAWPGYDSDLALKLVGIKSFAQVDERAFERLASKAGGEPRHTVELARTTVRTLAAAWGGVARQSAMPEEHIAALREHWQRVPLLRDNGAL